MEVIFRFDIGVDPLQREGLTFEKEEHFKYLRNIEHQKVTGPKKLISI